MSMIYTQTFGSFLSVLGEKCNIMFCIMFIFLPYCRPFLCIYIYVITCFALVQTESWTIGGLFCLITRELKLDSLMLFPEAIR